MRSAVGFSRPPGPGSCTRRALPSHEPHRRYRGRRPVGYAVGGPAGRSQGSSLRVRSRRRLRPRCLRARRLWFPALFSPSPVWRVPYPLVAGRRSLREPRGKVVKLADSFVDRDSAVLLEHGDAYAVVAAILQASQTVQKDRRSFSLADVANDSAHKGASQSVAVVAIRNACASLELRLTGAGGPKLWWHGEVDILGSALCVLFDVRPELVPKIVHYPGDEHFGNGGAGS